MIASLRFLKYFEEKAIANQLYGIFNIHLSLEAIAR